jgi:hypothetical protein
MSELEMEMAAVMAEPRSAELSQAAVDRHRIAAMHKLAAEPPSPAEADKPDGIDNLCPFGCTNEELNDIGHCTHLVGFTTNGKTLEPQVKRMRLARDPEGRLLRDDNGEFFKEWDGSWITDGRKESIQLVQKDDIPVNGGKNTRKSVSSRIYREGARVFDQ